MKLSRESFAVPFGAHPLRGDVLRPVSPLGMLLVLHGGGASTGEGFEALRAHVAAQQVASLSFDAVGHGRTGGPQLGTTLRQRVEQVAAVVDALGLAASELTLAGFSMGAYVAVHAAERLGIARLCLAIPAAYAPEAFDRPFGPAFSAVLRQPRSWAASDAFDRIARYRGHLLVLSAEHDAVVPAEIPARYHDAAVCARSRRHHVVAGAGHDLSRHYNDHPEARTPAYEAVAALCQAGLRPALPPRGSSTVAEPHVLERAPQAGLRPALPPRGSSTVAEPHVLERAPMHWRDAVPGDAAACIAVRGRTRENAVSEAQLRAYGITAESWAEGIRSGTTPGRVVERGGALLAYAFGDMRSGEVVVLAVLPEVEGLGLGRRLLSEVMQALRAGGHRRLFLGCTTDAACRSHGFYRHLGWRSTGRLDSHGDEVLEHLA